MSKLKENKYLALLALIILVLFLSLLVEVFGFNFSYFRYGAYDVGVYDVEYVNISDKHLIETNSESKIILKNIDKYVKNLTFLSDNYDYAPTALKISVDYIELEGGHNANLDKKVVNINKYANRIELSFNDAQQGKLIDLSNFRIVNDFQFNILRYLLTCFVVFLLGFSALFVPFLFRQKNRKFKVEYLALGTILLFGLIFTFLTPVQHTWDERSHFIRSYNFANGNFVLNENETISYPVGVGDFNIISKYNSYDEFKEQFKELLKYDRLNTEDKYVATPQIVYTPIPYVFSGIGVFVALLLKLPVIFYLYFGRLFNVIAYAFICFFAIRLIPHSKRLLFLISVLPVNLFMAASFSCDIVIIGFSFLAFSLILKWKEEEKVLEIKNIMLLWLMFFIVAMSKSTYAPMFLLCFLLRKENFKNKKMFIVFCVGSILLAGGSFIGAYIYGENRGIAQWPVPGINSDEQIAFILQNPIHYISIILNFLFSELGNLFEGVLSGLAYVGKMNSTTVLLAEMMIFFVALADNERKINKFDMKGVICVTIGTVATLLLSITALYVTFTPVGLNTVNGFQGRYLIPLFFPLLCLIQNKYVITKIRYNVLLIAVYVFSIFYLLESVFMIFGNFYM